MKNSFTFFKIFLMVGWLYWIPIMGTAKTFDAEETVNISVYEKTHNSVVNITTVVVDYDLFFTPYATESNGSGVVLDKKGHILTNHHVIADATQLVVTLWDSSKWEGTLIGKDESTDLGIIRIQAPPDRLRPIDLGNSSDIKVGQKVLAIGNPFGLEQTLTTGIISSIRRFLKINDVEMENVIQTDAAINPGNSGGPLLDSEGKMIGINTAIFTPSGGNVGVGFSVPVDTVKWVVQDLMRLGYVAYAWLGIEMQTLTPEYSQALKFPVKQGVLVGRMVRGGPADQAGIKGGSFRVVVGNTRLIIGGDIIIAADGQSMISRDDLVRFLKGKKPGDRIPLTIVRDNKKRTIQLTLGEKPRQ
ncbi:MAG TPA: trypsin-like peptidase domain-containing protein [Nitrospiria bacterium]|jgi:putative serine protease PepD